MVIASLRNKTLIYPCEAFKCQIECPCQMCRMKLSECDDFDDHLTFHLANHTMCRYCIELERFFTSFSYTVVYKRHYPNPSAWCGGQPDEKVWAVHHCSSTHLGIPLNIHEMRILSLPVINVKRSSKCCRI